MEYLNQNYKFINGLLLLYKIYPDFTISIGDLDGHNNAFRFDITNTKKQIKQSDMDLLAFYDWKCIGAYSSIYWIFYF